MSLSKPKSPEGGNGGSGGNPFNLRRGIGLALFLALVGGATNGCHVVPADYKDEDDAASDTSGDSNDAVEGAPEVAEVFGQCKPGDHAACRAIAEATRSQGGVLYCLESAYCLTDYDADVPEGIPLPGKCVFKDRADGSHCEDGDDCTAYDRCEGGDCQSGPETVGAPCDDGCNFGGQCAQNPEDADAPLICEGSSIPSSEACDDGNPCTQDYCVDSECVSDPMPGGTVCEKADACHDADSVCQGGVCLEGAQKVCADDEDACNGTEICDVAVGGCTHENSLPDGQPCSVPSPDPCFLEYRCVDEACVSAVRNETDPSCK